MNRFCLYITFGLLLLSGVLFAQDDCVLKLNRAERLYDAGKIELIPQFLNKCIADDGFLKEDKIQALRLLTLVYLFDDDLQKAEQTMLQLLKLDPEYRINKSIDPVEFIKLYNSFNTDAVFSIGVKGGLTFTMPSLWETYSRNSFSDANADYLNSGAGFVIGLNLIYHVDNKFDIMFEPSIKNLSFLAKENTSLATTTVMEENINYFAMPVIASYIVYSKGKYRFFGEAGISPDIYLSGSAMGTLSYINKEQPDIEPPEINTDKYRKKYNMSGVVGAGAKIKLDRSNIRVGLRYNIGMINIVNTENRYTNNDQIWNLMYIDNDFSINNISLLISYNYEFYIHSKKTQHKINYNAIE